MSRAAAIGAKCSLILEGKKMNFVQAIVQLSAGNKILRKDWAQKTSMIYLEINSGKIIAYQENGNYYELRVFHTDDFLANDWIIYEEPKDKETLWGYANFDYIIKKFGAQALWRRPNSALGQQIIFEIPVGFVTDSEERAWLTALRTFMMFKGHPLATAPHSTHGVQYYLTVYYGSSIKIDCVISPYIRTYISPSFNSRQDAEQAIKDIGKKELDHMFKTFQGIYD